MASGGAEATVHSSEILGSQELTNASCGQRWSVGKFRELLMKYIYHNKQNEWDMQFQVQYLWLALSSMGERTHWSRLTWDYKTQSSLPGYVLK